jgi:hypothetical protein
MDFIAKVTTISENLSDECEHELEWSLAIKDWAISESFTIFIHEVNKRNGSLRNQIINDTFIINVTLDDM